MHPLVRNSIYSFIGRSIMEHPNETMPFSAQSSPPMPQMVDPAEAQESAWPVRTDRLYQIAAVTAGLFLLATAL